MDIVVSSIWLHRDASRHRRGEDTYYLTAENCFSVLSEEDKHTNVTLYSFSSLGKTNLSFLSGLEQEKQWGDAEFPPGALQVGSSHRINGCVGPTGDGGVNSQNVAVRGGLRRGLTAVFLSEDPHLSVKLSLRGEGRRGEAVRLCCCFGLWFVTPGRSETGKRAHLWAASTRWRPARL